MPLHSSVLGSDLTVGNGTDFRPIFRTLTTSTLIAPRKNISASRLYLIIGTADLKGGLQELPNPMIPIRRNANVKLENVISAMLRSKSRSIFLEREP